MSATQMPFQEFCAAMDNGGFKLEYMPWSIIVLPWPSVSPPPYIIWLRSISAETRANEFVEQGGDNG